MLIDSHCHLHDPTYEDLRGTLARATEQGVWGAVAVGCDLETNVRTLKAATASGKAVWPAMGFHPEWHHLTDEDLAGVESQLVANHAWLVALGEVGLPWYSLEGASDAADRMTRARRHLGRLLDLARRYDLAVILHAPHGAAVGALEALKTHGIDRAVFHWHKAPAEVTRDIVESGYVVSVTPEVIYRERDREMVEAVPLTSLLVESDGPWPYKGEFEGMPSGPWLVTRVAEEIAKIKQTPVDEVIDQICANTCALFDLPWS
jgi:TatD DNase family protein